MNRAVLLLALVACGPKYTGSDVTGPLRRDPYLADGGRLYIPFDREHYDSYHDDGGIFCGTLVGRNECETDSSETTKVDKLGAIELDLATGSCSFVKRRPRGKSNPYVIPVRLGVGRTTPSGVHVVRDGTQIIARDAHGTRPILRDDKLEAGYLPNTDAILTEHRIVDVVDGESFDVSPPGIVRAGDRLFAATPNDGVLELTAAPIAKVDRHFPAFLIPIAHTTWMQSRPWPIHWTFGDVTLTRDGNALYLQFAQGRLLVADHQVPVVLFGDRYVLVDHDQLVDLKERRIVTMSPGIRRMGEYSSGLLIEGNDGAYYSTSASLGGGSIWLYGLHLPLIGVDRNELVFEHPWTTLEVLAFDVGKRSWRTLSYASCVPRNESSSTGRSGRRSSRGDRI